MAATEAPSPGPSFIARPIQLLPPIAEERVTPRLKVTIAPSVHDITPPHDIDQYEEVIQRLSATLDALWGRYLGLVIRYYTVPSTVCNTFNTEYTDILQDAFIDHEFTLGTGHNYTISASVSGFCSSFVWGWRTLVEIVKAALCEERLKEVEGLLQAAVSRVEEWRERMGQIEQAVKELIAARNALFAQGQLPGLQADSSDEEDFEVFVDGLKEFCGDMGSFDVMFVGVDSRVEVGPEMPSAQQ